MEDFNEGSETVPGFSGPRAGEGVGGGSGSGPGAWTRITAAAPTNTPTYSSPGRNRQRWFVYAAQLFWVGTVWVAEYDMTSWCSEKPGYSKSGWEPSLITLKFHLSRLSQRLIPPDPAKDCKLVNFNLSNSLWNTYLLLFWK